MLPARGTRLIFPARDRSVRQVRFAIPGDLSARTGGYAYDRALIAALGEADWRASVVSLPAGFPFPRGEELRETAAALGEGDPSVPLLIDGLAYGALPPKVIAAAAGPIVALIHHPLCEETGLSAADSQRFEASERAALAKAHAVVTTSSHTAEALTKRFAVPPASLTVAEPGLTAGWFDIVSQPLQPPEILSIGTLIPRKGHDTLLEALALSRSGARLNIVGASRDRGTAAALRQLAEAPLLAGRVTFHGELCEAALMRLMAGASLFALASRHEGYGMVFAEAMAAGLPVIGCRAGAVPTVVPEEAGILVNVDDATGLAGAIDALLGDEPRRAAMAAAARAAARRKTTWTDTGRQVAAVLGRVTEVNR